MGKPLSRPDCLRQNRTCLGKGEEEDGYIEDCYVPQRSIYDTMRINEQIDQGSKLNQLSKSTLGKGDSSTISSNGTLGATNVFESRAPETKKLDERVIFDALKLSSDVSKPAPAPPRRRPNPERKENVNRRSWKSFMPPNFSEFAERMGASLSEVSEAGASNPSLRDKRESSAMLTECPGQPDHGEPASESLTLEHVSKSSGTAEALTAKQLGADGYSGPRDERQPPLNAGDSRSRAGDLARARRLPSATWPRARKNFIKGSLSDGHQETLEAAESDCTVENVNLSPCLSEELLDAGLDILITSNLREKTESELRFEEDERWVMMEEWEEATLSERGKAVLVAEEKKSCCLADISEEREQFAAPTDDSAPSPGTCGSRASPGGAGSPLGGSTCCTEDAAVQCGAEDFAPGSERSASPTGPELSDTDSVQMFLELEEQCLNEDDSDGAVPVQVDIQVSPMDSEGLDPDSAKLAGAAEEACRCMAPLDVSASDSAVVSDLEDFDITFSSQVLSTLEPATEPFSERDTSAVTPTDSDGGASPSPVATAGLCSLWQCSPAPVEEGAPEPLVDLELMESCMVAVLVAGGMPSPEMGARPAAGLEGAGHPSAPVGWGEDNQDLLVADGEVLQLPEETCPDRASPCQPPAPDTEVEELESPPQHNESDGEGTDLSRNHHLLPGRTELSNWDVPELVSEDEVTDLGSEGDRTEGQTQPAESGDAPHGSLPPFCTGSASEPAPEAPATPPAPVEDLSWETVPLGQGLALEGAPHSEGSPVEVAVAHGEAPAAVLQPGDLDLLFACSGEERPAAPCRAAARGEGVLPAASPAAPEELPGMSPVAGQPAPDAIPWDVGGLSAPADLPAPGDVAAPEPQAQETPPATGDPTTDAEEPCTEHPPPDATTAAVPLAVEELLDAPPVFADVPAAAVPPQATSSLVSGVRDLGGGPAPLAAGGSVAALVGDTDDFASVVVLPVLEPLFTETPALEDDPVAGAPAAEVAAWDGVSMLLGTEGPPSAFPLPPEGPTAPEPHELRAAPSAAAPTAQTLPGAALRSPGPGGAPSPAPGEGEVTPGVEGPSAAALISEGAPALPDGFVPDNECVVVTQTGITDFRERLSPQPGRLVPVSEAENVVGENPAKQI
ncbi:uncharacterized protein VSU04_013580 [Chlamydotis macqueenii]